MYVRQSVVRGFVLALLASGCGAPAGTGSDRGPVVFEDNCGHCHGTAGEGDESLAAPSIAGLPEWYVKNQLDKFRNGQRGAHADDHAGLRMRPMSRSLETEDDVSTVAAHVASLTPKAPARTLHGDAEKGAVYYNTCTACHGPDGQGNEQLSAPPIVQLDDWYMLAQMKKFKTGLRGSAPGDTIGAQMVPMMATLPDEQAMLDVISHIGTFSN